MNYSDKPIHPTEPPPPQDRPDVVRPRRRRATRRQMIPTDSEGQAALIAGLAKRAYPSYEIYVYSILCGAVLGLGFMLDSQAVLLLGILLAPLMTPWVGLLLSILIGSPRFLFQTFMALLISAALIFLSGVMTGFASRVFPPLTFNNAFIHSRLWIPEIVVIALGAVLLVVSFVRSEAKPFLPSIIIAYAFFLPVSAAGFGLGSGVQGIWPQGALVLVTHFALANIFGLLTLFILRLRPSLSGLILSGLMVLVMVGILVFLMGPGLRSAREANGISPTDLPPLPSPTASLAAAMGASSMPRPFTATPRIETLTPTLTISPAPLTLSVTLPASEISTITLTIEPTPVYGKISSDGGGVNLRRTPNGKYLATLDNDSIVEVLPGIEEVDKVSWAHVIANKFGVRMEGWVILSAVIYATPAPNWEATLTPTITQTKEATATP